MKIEPEVKSQEETEQHALKQIERKSAFLGSAMLTPGHRVFEINTTTLECSEAVFETEVHFNAPHRRKITIKQECVYICALNIKNALKRYKRSYSNI